MREEGKAREGSWTGIESRCRMGLSTAMAKEVGATSLFSDQ